MKKRLSKHIICAILALACPFVAFLATLTYQRFANSDFWSSLTDSEGTTDVAGAMLAFSEFIQLVFFTSIGCAVGVVFAIISFWLWRRGKGIIVTE